MCFIMFLGANHSWLEHTHGLAEKLTVNIMAPGKPAAGLCGGGYGRFPGHYSRLHDCVGAQ